MNFKDMNAWARKYYMKHFQNIIQDQIKHVCKSFMLQVYNVGCTE